VIQSFYNHKHNSIMNPQFATARKAADVMPRTRLQGANAHTVGGVSKNVGGGRADLGVNSAFGFTHTSAADETVKIGDPTGAVAASGSKAVTNYTTGSKFTNAILNDLFYSPISVDLISWSVTAVSDFDDSFDHASINMGGKYLESPLNTDFTMSQRNTQQNSLLLTNEWPEGLVIGPRNCFFIQVDTTTVSVRFRPQAVYEV